MNFKMAFELPTAEEFVNLRISAGLSPRDLEGSKIGLSNSNFMVTFRDRENLIAMGRVVGDGATTFQITDVAVHPDFQGNGLGKAIMKECMAFLEKNASPNSYVSLIASLRGVSLYKEFGFSLTEPNNHGMYLFVNQKID
ncbi:MAG: GNAT family N-acetyltransferase [Defluviitaleaceae bacterium]|nr:GNAT family N-acetyltransferase [Defluviitaleaceae bacterium]